MLVGTNGVVINELAQVLLIRRNDTRTMAPPGGSLESGELPTDSLAREVREETGLIVMPVRLVGLYFLPLRPHGMLAFVFRCIQRGGQLGTTEEAPVTGFYSSRQLPSPMIPFHRQRLEQAIAHRGGPPVWVDQPLFWWLRVAKFLLDNLVYRYLDLRRAWRRQRPFQPAAQWKCSAYVVMTNDRQQVLWQNQSDGRWALPGGICHHMESPWKAIDRIAGELGFELQLTDLCAVYVESDTNHLRFVFAAQAISGRPSANSCAFFDSQQVPRKVDVTHQAWVADARGPTEETIFRRIEAAIKE